MHRGPSPNAVAGRPLHARPSERPVTAAQPPRRANNDARRAEKYDAGKYRSPMPERPVREEVKKASPRRKSALPGMETQKRVGKLEGQGDLFDMGKGEFNAVEIERSAEREQRRQQIEEESKHADDSDSGQEIYQIYEEMCKVVAHEFDEHKEEKQRKHSPQPRQQKRAAWNKKSAERQNDSEEELGREPVTKPIEDKLHGMNLTDIPEVSEPEDTLKSPLPKEQPSTSVSALADRSDDISDSDDDKQ
jgi:hypothetical protein